MKDPLYLFLGALAGGLVGFLYYRIIGCRTGACLLTSKPLPAILYGAFIGATLGGR